MSFRDFDLTRVRNEFGVRCEWVSLFPRVPAVAISPELAAFWGKVQPLALNQMTEKARSEWLIAPLLAEVWNYSRHEVMVLSGMEWNVDPASGLNGTADFLLCRSKVPVSIEAPVLVVVEAKRDSIADGLGQCAAEMVAAQRFNAQAGTPMDPIYGCVTTGSVWKFLRLSGIQLDIDLDEYTIHQPDRILGVLLYCCGVTV